MTISKTEPVVVRTTIVAAVTAVIHLLVVLGLLDMTMDQELAIGSTIDIIGTAVAVLWSRQAVSPVSKVEDAVKAVQEAAQGVSQVFSVYAAPAGAVDTQAQAISAYIARHSV